jgi:hypothetical protein
MIKDEYIKLGSRSKISTRKLKNTVKTMRDKFKLEKPNIIEEPGQAIQTNESDIIHNQAEFDEFIKTFRKQWRVYSDQYLLSLNARQSYLYAYPKSSVVTATNAGAKLLLQPDIQKYLQYMHNKRLQRFNISKTGILCHLTDIVEESFTYARKYKKQPSMVAVKAIEVISRITGDITPTNSNNTGSDLVIVKCYVVPQIANNINLPEPTADSARKAVEGVLKK